MIPYVVTSAALLIACTIVIAQETTKRPSDTEITKLVVGKWSQNQKLKTVEIKAKDDFSNDGTWKSQGTLTIGDKVVKLTMTGTWKISDGFLIQVIGTCDPPTLKKGHESKDEVLSISRKRMNCKTRFGTEIIRIRLPE